MRHAVRNVSMNIKAILLLSIVSVYLPILTQGNHTGQQRNIENITIDLNVKNVSLNEAFRQITKSTKIRFSYRNADLEHVPHVSIRAEKEKLIQILNQLTKTHGLEWKLLNDVIVIRKLEVKELRKTSVLEDTTLQTKGIIRDENNNPVPGVSILIKRTTRGTTTNEAGEFILTNVERDATLVFSSVGFLKQEIRYSGEPFLDIKMLLDVKEIEAVSIVSTGYQDIPKERATGSFVHLDNIILNRSVSTNIMDRIRGVTSGLNFEPTMRGTREITIRGNSSINANPRPLIVIDGFPYDESADFENVINSVNPNDVESITVLKDAAAASIWGARAGNGVIVIKTKKGQLNRKTKVQLNSNINIIDKPNLFYMPVISSDDLVDFEKRRFLTGYYDQFDDVYPGFNYFPALSQVIETLLAERKGTIEASEAAARLSNFSQTDVRKDINDYLLQTGINQQYALNISGGTSNYAYYASIGYDKNRSTNVRSEQNRMTLRYDNTYRLLRNLEISSFLAYAHSDNRNNSIGFDNLSPYTSLLDHNDNPSSVPRGLRLGYIDTANYPALLDWHYRPLDELEYNNNSTKDYDNRIGANIKYIIIDGLNVELKYQYQRLHSRTENILNSSSFDVRNLVNQFMYIGSNGVPVFPIPLGNIIDRLNQETISWNARGQVGYDKSRGVHNLTSIVGIEGREVKSNRNTSRLYGYDPTSGSIVSSLDYTTLYPVGPDGFSTSRIPNPAAVGSKLFRYISYFANASYTYNRKYTISASARVDGSNFFGVKTNQRIVPLWSSGVLWNIHEEKFFDSELFEEIKLRATYGYNGNTNNSATAYATMEHSQPSSSALTTSPFGILLFPPNPMLRWEKVGISNIGLDFALRDRRFSGSIEYYHKNAIDLIGQVLVDPTSGFTDFIGNNASMKGSGLDLIINSENLKGELKWRTNILFSFVKERVTSYESVNALTSASYINSGVVIGKPLFSLFSYRWAGLDAKNGDPMGFVADTIAPYNVVLTGTNTNPEDLIFHGTRTPKIFGSFLNTFTFKGLSFSFNILYKFDYYFRRNSIQYGTLYQDYNLTAHGDYRSRWMNPGDELVTYIPSDPGAANDLRDRFYLQSEILVEKGDHIRLQDVRLSYDFNNIKHNRIPFKNVQVYGYASNLGIIWRANKSGIDPDYNGGIPPAKTFAFGLNFGF